MTVEEILNLDKDYTNPVLIQFTDEINSICDCKFVSGMKAYITGAFVKAEGLIVIFEEREFKVENSKIFNPHKYVSNRNHYCVDVENGEINGFKVIDSEDKMKKLEE